MSQPQHSLHKDPDQESGYQPAHHNFIQQQQSTNSNIIVMSQPQQQYPVIIHQPVPRSSPKVLIFAVVMIVVMGVQMIIPSLMCIIPGLILAIAANYFVSKEQTHTIKALNGVSICCNLTGLIFYVIGIMTAVVFILYISIGVAFRSG